MRIQSSFSIQQSLDLLASKVCSVDKFGKCCIFPPPNSLTFSTNFLKGVRSTLVKQLALFSLAFPTKVFPLPVFYFLTEAILTAQ